MFPAPSVAEHETSVVPSGKLEPEAGEQETGTGEPASLAVAEKVTVVSVIPSTFAAAGAGRSSVGTSCPERGRQLPAFVMDLAGVRCRAVHRRRAEREGVARRVVARHRQRVADSVDRAHRERGNCRTSRCRYCRRRCPVGSAPANRPRVSAGRRRARRRGRDHEAGDRRISDCSVQVGGDHVAEADRDADRSEGDPAAEHLVCGEVVPKTLPQGRVARTRKRDGERAGGRRARSLPTVSGPTTAAAGGSRVGVTTGLGVVLRRPPVSRVRLAASAWVLRGRRGSASASSPEAPAWVFSVARTTLRWCRCLRRLCRGRRRGRTSSS